MYETKAFTGAAGKLQAEKVGQWFKALAGNDAAKAWCVKHGVGLTKAAAEVPDSAGGFLVPDSFDAGIIRVLELVGAFRQGAEVRPNTSDSQIRPRRTGGITANWISEGQSIPESTFQLDAVQSTMKKLGALVRCSSELFEDSASDLGQFLTTEFAYAFASIIDDAGFNGDGSSTYRGIQGLGTRLAGTKGSVAAASGHSTYALVDNTDLSNLIGAVMGSAMPGAAWYCSATCFALLFCRLAGTSGGLLMSSGPGGRVNASYQGWPIRISAKLPDVSTSLASQPMLYFGDLSMSSLLTERRALVVGMSRQHALDTDQVLIRATARLDIVNHDTGSATVKGPVACLIGTS